MLSGAGPVQTSGRPRGLHAGPGVMPHA